MKKRNITISISVGLLLTTMLTACKQSESSLPFSREDAKALALKHAGVSTADVREYESELDFERGVEVYEISFSVGRTEYDYTIDVKTGKVIRAERENLK